MTVVAIIGILASIAIPSYNKYRAKSYNASAKVQLHNIMLTEQTLFSTGGSYLAVAAGIGPGMMGVLPNQNASNGVGYIVHLPLGAGAAKFTAYTGHIQGTQVFAGSENTGPLWNLVKTGMTPVQDAQTQPNAVLLSSWGNR